MIYQLFEIEMNLLEKNEILLKTSKMTDSELSKESRIIKFILLILVSTLSSICAGYIFYNVIKYPIIRRRFHNQTLIIHVILVALYTLFNIPTTIRFDDRLLFIEKNIEFLSTVFMLEVNQSLIIMPFASLGKSVIIYSVHRLFGVKLS